MDCEERIHRWLRRPSVKHECLGGNECMTLIPVWYSTTLEGPCVYVSLTAVVWEAAVKSTHRAGMLTSKNKPAKTNKAFDTVSHNIILIGKLRKYGLGK